MSDLIIKKNGTDYELPMLAEHYPADRVYLNGNINNTVQDALSYSTTEKIVGTWVDGKTIYKKTVYIPNLPNATSIGVTHGITNLDNVIKSEGYARNGNIRLPLPYVGVPATDSILMYVSGTQIVFTSSGDGSAYSGYVTLYYTKTT